MNTIVWFLIATASSNTSAITLMKLNDKDACVKAATDLYTLSKNRTGAPYIYAYCIPVQDSNIVR